MADYGSRVAEKAIKSLEKEIHAVYKQAALELREKFKTFVEKHAVKDRIKREMVRQGLITKQEYKNWLGGQLFMEKQWKDKIDQATKIMNHANTEAAMIVNQRKMDVFAENYNYAAYELEKGIKANIGFNIYSTETVQRLMTKKPDLLPKWKIDQAKDYVWNATKANNAILQGIIQGEGVEDITKRLITSLCSMNENKMRTFARTSVTNAQNAGRMEMMHDTIDEGIHVRKKWLATLDDRTRDAHQQLDGQVQEVDDPFESELGDIMFPGDPSAEPANVFNCRCTMIYVYDDVDYKSIRRDGNGEFVENMTYSEWKEWKEGQ